MPGRGVAVFVGALLFSVAISLPSVPAWEVDQTASVTSIIDGDTFDCSPTGRIRLADVDAPEYYETGYQEAKDALSGLISGQTVYLDIDDVYGTDPYDRWVAVVYVRYNATHLRNVNQGLLDAGVAVVSDYTNEFNPSTWSAYVFYPVDAPPPSVTASANPTDGRAPLTVTFSATASGGIPPYAYSWTFGDGGSSPVQSPSHTYTIGGTFFARVTVTDAARRSGATSFAIRVIGPLSVTASAMPSQGAVPLTVSFAGSASDGEPPYSFEWDFGDGNSSTLQSTSHTYTSAGTYVTTLTVTDTAGSSVNKTVVIGASPPPPSETTGPAGGAGPLSGPWTYVVLVAVIGVAVAVVGLRASRRGKDPPKSSRARR